MNKKNLILIVGPTAAGKTAVAIEVARYFHTEIISADSRQCYTEMNIGVVRPSEEELKIIPHHFIASHSVDEDLNAAYFEQYALSVSKKLFEQYDTLVMVGGTGLYIKAFCEGMDVMPEIDAELRKDIRKEYDEKGIEWLQRLVKEEDPEFYSKGEIQNPQRMMRALEVTRQTGRSILSFRTAPKAKRDFNIIKIGLELSKEQLHSRINHRVDVMMEAGLLDEVRSLQPFEKLNALQTVGYRELFDHLHGNTDLDTAVELIKKNTRQYAKRQLTWFRRDKDIRWFDPMHTGNIISYISSLIH